MKSLKHLRKVVHHTTVLFVQLFIYTVVSLLASQIVIEQNSIVYAISEMPTSENQKS